MVAQIFDGKWLGSYEYLKNLEESSKTVKKVWKLHLAFTGSFSQHKEKHCEKKLETGCPPYSFQFLPLSLLANHKGS
jgi:hypothetical protein